MSGLALHWNRGALAQTLAAVLPDVLVEVVAEIDSTNSELMRRARAGSTRPTLLVAETQTAGRGRLGRTWQQAAPGASLSFSLSLPLAPRDWSGLSLAVGLSVAESLHPAIGLKWPNDLWWQDRKLAGILVETAGTADPSAHRQVVIGIGMNIAPLADGKFSTPAAWLQTLLPAIDAPAALQKMGGSLAQAVKAFEHDGFAPLVGRFRERDVLIGRPVRLSDGREGVAQGVASDGALHVQTKSGLVEVISAEVSVRPKHGVAASESQP